MSDQLAVDGNRQRQPVCGHTKSSVRMEWDMLPPNVPGEPMYLPHRCAECGLLVPVPPTFGGSLLFALCGVLAIVLLAALGVLPYILMGILAILAICFVLGVVSSLVWLVKRAVWLVKYDSR